MPVSHVRTAIPTSSWQWRLSNSNGTIIPDGPESRLSEWMSCSTFPSVIHQELLALNLIPDPNVGENERLIQWVGKCDWEYRCSFNAPDDAAQAAHVDVVFEGLDTFASVTLNGTELLKTHNMFIPRRVDVKQLLRPENEMLILFESAVKKGEELEKEHGERFSMMRDKKRMHMRKAQYSWGWDWGPIMVTCGPYLPIYIETFTARISNLYLQTANLAEDHSFAEIACEVTVSGSVASDALIELTITDQSETVITQTSFPISSDTRRTSISISNPKLWWPHLQGSQHLYTVSTKLISSSSSQDQATTLDTRTTRFGVRTITLIQRPLTSAPGKTFLFNVNGRDIFVAGGDWIPCDMLLPSVTPERYRAWIEIATRANLNMLRIWGGGIYEADAFFDACDELGILIWHDYAFACGDYPVHSSFLENVREEVEVQTRRLRGRASLALLCGGNEDFMLADWSEEFGRDKVEYDNDDTEGPFLDKTFPQREIYLKVVPSVAAGLCPDIPYWPNSPWGGATSANDRTIGDTHMWDVWHGKQLSYQSYKNHSSRFISEFGMHAYPDMRTVDVFAPNPKDRHPQSIAIDCHNKGHGGEVRIARYLAENFRYSNKLEDFVYCSQLLQSEAYGYALRDWKRKFGGKGEEECAGAIIWQLNDVYPVTSWAFVDYYLRPKPAFYTIARAFAPISVGISRDPWSRWIDEDRPRESEIPRFEIFAHSTTSQERKVKLTLAAWDMHTNSSLEFPESEKEVTLKAGCNTELGEVKNPKILTEESLVILCAKLVDTDGKVLSRIVNWPEPYRYLEWSMETKVHISVDNVGVEWETVSIESNRPVKGCILFLNHSNDAPDAVEPIWEDNMLDLLPGEKLTVRVKGRRGRDIKIKFLDDWELP